MHVDKEGYLWNLCEGVNETMRQTAEQQYKSKESLIFDVTCGMIFMLLFAVQESIGTGGLQVQ